jgi:DNA-directed RNA polymerase beta' subunit
MNKWHAMMLFSNIQLDNNIDITFDKMNYTGRDMIGKFLPKINYPKRAPQMYNPDYAPFIKYDPEEIVVEINRGELVSGILDKKSVGQGKPGTIFHIINNEYGAKRALDTLHNFHQIIMKFYLWNGCTIGMSDIILPEHASAIIRKKTEQIIKEAGELTEQARLRELIPPIGTPINKFYESEMLTTLSLGDEFIAPIYSNIDTDEGLAQLVTRGSKGDAKNAMAIYAAIGQMSIGSGRVTKNFGKGRTSSYFLRGDKSPRANGFVENSYRDGIESDIYPFISAEARYNEVMKALSTSVAGSQGRICGKNIESIVAGNLHNSVKGDAILQLLYADTGIDPAKVEHVKFITALISDKELEEKFKSDLKNFDKIYHNETVKKALAQEFDCIKNDRSLFREIAFKLHNGNIGKNGLISNERYMAINPYRIIEDILYTYRDELAAMTASELRFDPIKAINDVNGLCTDMAYCYFNKYYQDSGKPIPEYIDSALTLVKILLRQYLCTAQMKKKNVTNKLLSIIIEKIKRTFKKAFIPYGTAIGVIAAQCISEPQTQYMIDSKLRAGTGGAGKTPPISRVKEITGAKSTEDMKNTSMTIMLKPEYSGNKSIVQEVANNIEMMKFDRFITSGQLFFESYGNPVHQSYAEESKMIKEFEKYYTPDVPSNLSKWCMRFELNKEELFVNGMNLSTIILNLQIKYSDIFFVHTSDNANKIIIRGYLLSSNKEIKVKNTEQSITKHMHEVMDTNIRGISGINYTGVSEVSVSKVMDNGSIENVREWYIETNGTNLEEVLEHPMVDKYRTQCDSVAEMTAMYGIECGRMKIVRELQKAMNVDDAATEHAMLISDEMCCSGVITSIQKTGLQSRDAGNIGLQIAFQAPIQAIEKAAIHGIYEVVEGISSNLIYGQVPSIGTTYNEVVLNEEFMEDWYKKRSQEIEDIL